MNWEDIAGQDHLKKILLSGIEENRISHAQLFAGKDGYGTFALALAYAAEILEGEKPGARHKVSTLNHVDLHLSFPVFTEKNNTLSKRFFEKFREMMLANPYSSLEDWSAYLDSENKQLFISADEVDELNQQFALKSFEGGTKILIIYRADKLNNAASNKLLKFLEEPPEKTVIILTAAGTEELLPTILSRTQVVDVPRIADEEMHAFINKNFQVDGKVINEIIFKSQGDFRNAQRLLEHGDDHSDFEEHFITWVRDASQVVKTPEHLANIIKWSRVSAAWNRETQKNFLQYCTEIFRLALMQNYGASDLVYNRLEMNGFRWDKFSEYIHGANIASILQELSEADYHLARNGNPKIVWTDLGIKLSRYLNKPA